MAGRSRRTRPARSSLLLPGAVWLIVGGCQSYERAPLDLAAHQRAFDARTPEAARPRAPADAPGGAFDPTDGVSCEEAEAIALVYNADLRLARLRAGVALATAESAGLWADPVVSVDITRIIDATPDPWKVFPSIGLTIPLSGRLEVERQRAGAGHAVALARVSRQEWQTRMDVRRAWTEWRTLEARAAAAREFIERTEAVLTVVSAMEHAGEIPRVEARLFRIERATRQAELGALDARVREADLRLRSLCGLSPGAPLRWQAGSAPTLLIGPASTGAGEVETALLTDRNPDVLVAQAEYEVAEKSLELEVRKQYPDLHIGPGYGLEDGQSQVLLGLSMPIPILNGNRQGLAEARAERNLARATAEAALERAVAEAYAAVGRLAGAQARRQALEAEIVPMVEAQHDDARALARLGEVSALVLIDSLSRLHDVRVAHIEAMRDEALACIDLQAVTGPPPPPSPVSTTDVSDPN